MLFPTLSFAAFFGVVMPISWLLMPHRVKWRLFMVAASWIFYGTADWRFVPLLAGSTVVNHYFARRIHQASGPSRKLWTIGAVTTNLVVLAWFKYIGFLSLSAHSILRFAGVGWAPPLPEVLLPIGISFFTFQALSYVIDTGRGKVKPVSLLEFAVYLSFFPHLVAGPIVRASEFLPQIRDRIRPNVDVGKAFWLIAMGLFKKVVIASYLGTYAADPLFGFPRQHGGIEAAFGVYAYAIQIYADFSGYTDIAIGLALLLGVQFPQNFNAPYSAASLQDFWRRWHMTLSRWLRDYLYIPLGGSRRGKVRTYINIMITMLLGGLWHGAAWTFVAWGGLHGVGLVVERLMGERHRPPLSGAAAPPPAAPTPREAAGPLGAGDALVHSPLAGEEAPASVTPAAVTGAPVTPAAVTPAGAVIPANAAGSRPRKVVVALHAEKSPEPPSVPDLVVESPASAVAVEERPLPPRQRWPEVTTTAAARTRRTPSPAVRLWVGRLITFHVVCLAWIFFRATSFHNAIEVLGRIASFGGQHQPLSWKVVAVVIGALAVQLGPRGLGARLQASFSRMPWWAQALSLTGVLTVIDLLGPAGIAPFIYFRF